MQVTFRPRPCQQKKSIPAFVRLLPCQRSENQQSGDDFMHEHVRTSSMHIPKAKVLILFPDFQTD